MVQNNDKYGTKLLVSRFTPENGIAECHLMLTSTRIGRPFESQLEGLLEALHDFCHENTSMVPVFKRYFLSDSANQSHLLPRDESCAVSVVEQALLNGTKVAIWVYLQQDVKVQNLYNGMFRVEHGAYRHFWQGCACTPDLMSEVATRALLLDYALRLEEQECSLRDNCVRTWFFVQNVDVNYAGVVKGRNEVFATQGLTKDTHYISSTGICGRHADPRVIVEMDAYAVHGLKPRQMGYLYAKTHLNPTYEYGVSFERGTTVDYGDRRQFFLSGTASIDNKGNVMYPGDVRKQTLRMWENVEALLAEGGAGWDDVVQMVVYLRDPSDYAVVNEMYEERFAAIPHVIVLAPVCRPGWLIEMECMAVKAQSHSAYEPL